MEDGIKPVDIEREDQVICPSCGNWVGPVETCPHCQASLHKRMSIRVFKYGSLVMAFLGVFALWYVSRHMEIPLVKIKDMGPTMNFAYIRVKGRVVNVKPYTEENKKLSFTLDDGTGSLYIVAYRSEAERIVAMGKEPGLGDEVEVAGNLRIKENFNSLMISLAERMKVYSPPVVRARVGDIKAGDIMKKFCVTGMVKNIRKYPSIVIVTLSDPDSEEETIDITYRPGSFQEEGLEWKQGELVDVTGIVNTYKGSLQIVPNKRSDIIFSGDISVPSEDKSPPAEIERDEDIEVFEIE